MKVVRYILSALLKVIRLSPETLDNESEYAQIHTW
jgi:hypothetical protein